MATFKGAAREAQRAALLMKQREKERQELEIQKRKLEAEMRVGEMSTKFAVHYDAIEYQLKNNTIGLVTLDEMKARQKAYMTQREKELALGNSKGLSHKSENAALEKKNKLQPSLLSFAEEEDVEDTLKPSVSDIHDNDSQDKTEHQFQSEEAMNDEGSDLKPNNESCIKRRRLGKNPAVDTSFLPDIDRDEEEKRLREELRREWVAKQAAIKEEEIVITYSYWDGSGHRKQVRMKKGHSIHLFLHRCVEQLRKDFSELKSASADQMMYIKEDLIIPHHYTFYDFIVTKARGKSGPLFCFDVHDDVRIRMDANVEKEESHAGKVCLRSWYERNKHIFPASRWEPYDPAKNWDHYTVSDKMAAKITVK
ncbi:Protein FAM50 [Schistosoma japonicum]|uniref:Protein FAM50 n=1 Tax=Schistosoma japonicum TaxID=6182 RepID=Q5DA73_SCHJA|nr:unknown [Schistosoma japonicum]KAH8860876.1 Protein FAM50 like [Schistosoma japonicum]KAH8860877.1 Protein FAM50 like [Schistosoma japonicum]KAH8860878.1 Protein FAM50 like [Schistosoma japonicum]TNN18048.1 Protein FAM50 [Schistosoma japonicum]